MVQLWASSQTEGSTFTLLTLQKYNIVVLTNLCYVTCTSVPLSPTYYTITTFPYHVATAHYKTAVMIKLCSI